MSFLEVQMRFGMLSWNLGFYEYNKKDQRWIIPCNENRETDKIAEKILSHASDIIVLNEFGENSNRPNNPINCKEIVEILEDNGYKCEKTNNWYRSILIAIKENSGLKFYMTNNKYGSSYTFGDKLIFSLLNKAKQIAT